ncbi:MAG: peptidyl-prolyl cis-trans isomerase [Gammaproteobacteria bacterium]|nr:peptidyl-prolyl cis-trans isomerase [Gammaproteobacteria bacterium]
MADLDAALLRAPGEVRSEYSQPAAIEELVQSLVDRRLMAAAARNAGLPGDVEVQRQLATARAAGVPDDFTLADAWLARQLLHQPGPTDADVLQYYRAHAEAYSEPRRVYITRVVTVSAESAARLRQDLLDGATPEALRSRYGAVLRSVDQLWLQDGPALNDLSVVALALEPGAVSPVIAVGGGAVVIRGEKTRPARMRPLEDVRTGIVGVLEQGSRDATVTGLMRTLREGHPVAVDRVAIESYSAGLQRGATAPPGAE